MHNKNKMVHNFKEIEITNNNIFNCKGLSSKTQLADIGFKPLMR